MSKYPMRMSALPRCILVGVAGTVMTTSLATPLAFAQSVASAAAQPARVYTAVEDARNIRLHRALADVDQLIEYRRKTDVDMALAQRARTWLESLRGQSGSGIQLDALGELHIIAGQDAQAQRQFSDRLATPGLSVMDRAYTLYLAVTTFGAKAGDSARMRIASDYAKQLDALPGEAAFFQYYANTQLANAHYLLGNGTEVVAHMLNAFARIPNIPFMQRTVPGGEFTQLADVLSGKKDGRRIIDSVANRLLALFQAPSELVAIDSDYYRKGYDLTQDFKHTLQFTSYLGRPAPVITAQYWWNTTAPSTPSTTAPGATIKRLDDGKVRLIEIGSVTCHWCMKGLADLEKIHATLPSNAEAWYVTKGYGVWGSQPCLPDQEAKHLAFVYLTQNKYRLPIALWIGPRVDDDDGGSLSQNNPMWEMFGLEGGPIFFVTDGKGLVRHVSIGAPKGLEPQLRTLQFVLAETAHEKAVSEPDASGSPTAVAVRP